MLNWGLLPADPTQVLSSHGVRELEQTGNAEDKTKTDSLKPLKQSYPRL